MSRWLAAAILTCVAAVSPGCMTVRNAPASAPAEAAHKAIDDGDIWPRRWGDDRPGLGRGVVIPVEGPLSAWSPRRHGPFHQRLPDKEDEKIVRALAEGRVGDEGYRFRMEGFGAFVFERDPDVPPPAEGAPPAHDEPAFMFVFASGRIDETQPASPHVDVQRTWFAYYDQRRDGHPDADDPGKGVILLLPGLFGVPEKVMDIMVATMRQNGWNVVRMLAPPADLVARTDLVLDPANGDSPRQAASELMDRIAETAYSSEAAMRYVLGERPELRGRPKVVLGGSAGAMALPAVMKRDPDLYDAAVIIGGGSNILDIVSRSTFTQPVDALEFDWAGEPKGETPPRDVLDTFTASYLKYAPLDGANAAGAFKGKPVLMLQASADEAVPRDSGDRLWSLLGEPERWLVQGNHMTLFLSLWLYTPRMMAWLDDHVLRVEP